ncbi:MAG: peptidoglycan-binding protein [Clostridia bacterium]|nr:peptidoglycan-binding protein [Clostridia bacterium]
MKNKKMRFISLLAVLAVMVAGWLIFDRSETVHADSAIVAQSDFKTLKVGMGGQQVRQMQTVLKDLVFYSGAVNGNFSREFETAVKDFQADFGIEITGQIDYELYTLLIEDFSDFATAEPPKATKAPARATQTPQKGSNVPPATEDPFAVEEDEWYTDKDHVAAYLKKYGKLPGNYITKNDARKLGWNGSRSGLWDVAYGMSIGGDKFGNYEELLPVKKGRQYYECDIDFDGWEANAKRIVYSNDGLIFYTEDHYETFEEIK